MRHARSSKTRYPIIAHGVMVPSHHTTVDGDIHSLCDCCIDGKDQGQRKLGSSRHRVVDEPSGTCSKAPSTFDVIRRQSPLIRWKYTVSDCACTLAIVTSMDLNKRGEGSVSNQKHEAREGA